MVLTAKKHPENPPAQLQAGGGNASSSSAGKSIETFAPLTIERLKTVYKDISGGAELDSNHADRFLRDIQHAPNSIPTALDKPKSDLDDFFKYMSSPESSAFFAPAKQDLTFPISNYFISTSHNTYLTGNQLYSESSADAYRNVLLRGCRCLEIDVWDGDDSDSSSSSSDEGETPAGTGKLSRRTRALNKLGSGLEKVKLRDRSKDKKNVEQSKLSRGGKLPMPGALQRKTEPRVLHGYTLTKDVPFRDVCAAIQESAFVATDLPVIVSLEVHAGLEQQEIMVEIMRKAFKGMLVDISRDEEVEVLPSPEDLRKKILIKVKWAPPEGDKSDNSAASNDPHDHVAEDGASGDDDDDDESLTEDQKQRKKKSSKILHTLSQLGVYTRAYKFSHFEQPESKIPVHVFSLSEKKVQDVRETQAVALFEHNRDYFMRTYPSGMRVTSSNLEPTFLWRQGVQMVALNWQRWDKGMMLNEGMFAGENGWVLKPTGYLGTRGKGATIDRSISPRTLELRIELFAAQGLPTAEEGRDAKKLRPYVKIQLHVDDSASEDVKGNTGNGKEVLKQRSKTSSGPDADFGGEVFQFSKIQGVIEELSFLSNLQPFSYYQLVFIAFEPRGVDGDLPIPARALWITPDSEGYTLLPPAPAALTGGAMFIYLLVRSIH